VCGESVEGAIDLHVHTTRSDGDYTPADVVRKAAAMGLVAIAVTDHDTVDGVVEGLETGDRENVEVVPGVELSVQCRGFSQVHLLGYYLDWEAERLGRTLSEIREARVERGRKLVDRINDVLASQGRAPLGFDEVERHASGLIGRPHIAKVLLERGYAKNMAGAFKRYLIPYNIPKFKPFFREAVEAVKGAGGIPVLAHPNLITPGERMDPAVLEEMVDWGLMGLEVYYRSLGPDDTRYYRDLAEKHGLLVTGGSDFHGEQSYGNLGHVGEAGTLSYGPLRNLKKAYTARRAFLVVLCGLPRTGKSTLARRLAGFLDAEVLSSDAVRLSAFPPETTDPKTRYAEEVSAEVYRRLRLEAETNLQKGRSVVLDATSLLIEGRRDLVEVSRKTGAPLLFISCSADEETVARRAEGGQRDLGDVSEADFAVYRRMKEQMNAQPDRFALPEDDPSLDGFPILGWDSTGMEPALSVLASPDNLAYMLRFSLG